ncbi:hypothetical protein ALNOE001_03490 [Candidatus Methanobinarius endosymbioticus]|uniref:YitT family protein n=1 Tax=Candidatus Methanobinarius endosymbioticus TaxID=2006182 RepID=A0A366MFK4_9EURY|nr:hypothetical protein ALNOE001_03490 [Candidatus Methanobinarius endosymbioticus]
MIVFSVLGIVILSFGVSVLRVGNAGLDPFTASNLAIGVNTLHLSSGVYQLMVNIVILILVFIFKRELIGIGTLINMVFVGFIIDFFTGLYHQFFDITITFPIQLIFLLVDVLIFTLGTSMYIASKLGNVPHDSIALILVDHTKFSYRTDRVALDIVFSYFPLSLEELAMNTQDLGRLLMHFLQDHLLYFGIKEYLTY